MERLGRDDNFFLLGGHSLVGAQLIVLVRTKFGAPLTLRDLMASVESMSEEEAIRILSLLEAE